MRISHAMNFEQVKTGIQKNQSQMADLQAQAASMKRVTKPSDDPVGAARVLGIRTTTAGNDQLLKNIDIAKTFINYSEAAMAELGEVLSRAKELAIGQSSDASANPVTRIAVASEVDQMFNDVVNIGNRKFGERFVFGGFRTTDNPFNMKGQYLGDSGEINIEINRGVFVPINMTGDKLFLGKGYRVAGDAPPPPKNEKAEEPGEQKSIEVRGPASQKEEPKAEEGEIQGRGENIFRVLRTLSDGLKANDTKTIQSTLERLDGAMEQVLMLRAEIGSRFASMQNTYEGLGKTKIDDMALMSSIEDADAFNVFSDISKNETTLKATLQTSGKLIQPSLLDFLR